MLRPRTPGAGVTGAEASIRLSSEIAALINPDGSTTQPGLRPVTVQRLQHGATHLHRLRPPIVDEFLAGIAAARGGLQLFLDELECRRRLSPEMVRLLASAQLSRRLPVRSRLT
jgi:hypothetical protein